MRGYFKISRKYRELGAMCKLKDKLFPFFAEPR